MHFEFLIEDKSGKVLIEKIINKLVNTTEHTFEFHSYRGIGRLPKNLLKNSVDPKRKTLLAKLPAMLKAYGKSYCNYNSIVFVVCDLDRRCLVEFRKELHNVLATCNPAPQTVFCFAIEEMEAWLLGDLKAIKKAYPRAKNQVLTSSRSRSGVIGWGRSLPQMRGITSQI